MAPRPKLTLYIDTVSPFAYIAYHVLRNDPVFKECEITYIPVFLGGIMKACNNVPPISIKNKDAWINVERKRWARLFNVPMADEAPEGFPHLTLTIMRALCALIILHPGDEGQDVLAKALEALCRAYWVDKRKTFERDVLVEVLAETFGGEEAEKVMATAGQEGKALLAKNSEQAVTEGAFGLPYFVATNSQGETDRFWGVDHMGLLTMHLGLKKPATGGWRALL
ncbi:uncharacterized protein L3040_000266 [Drepanopeziza brunnea f. sp. 'multigermtubi']|uniref:Glutathione S-transferase kappa n=1 Tax=Marssonina brunnea f. sp. multigermtubi (strain MB_m1) TaxID=1072389 RepID=K1XII2_MARBU|nr:2-hydroxychromene-2-carboxylate isomerase [Drepanopeziza brunnea f. sp. 'multigermtubi' MB_m1]EKD12264.1 2-hydroxychromene-2-carboxylate isomerase [Drepanopeziza brunnea f. sp. 'multigermtubi' MB_m1]KAJ5053978.1 hypothetical protein L3040_000266 [Drepanopeziza brunnea f. sp. 'multigermtubi']